jgi:PAS domain S-box-containing protein
VDVLVRDEAILSDPARLAAVRRAAQLLPAMDLSLDDVARLAAHSLGAPMATLCLVGADRTQRLGAHGLPPALAAHDDGSLPHSFAGHVVCDNHLTHAADLPHDADPRLREHPLVRSGVRAYIAVPIRDGAGRPLGALTVFDTRPRRWHGPQELALMDIAGLLTASVRWDGRAASTAPMLDGAALLDSVQEAFVAVDTGGIIRGFNRAAERLLGYTAAQVCCQHLEDTVLPDYRGEATRPALQRLFAAGPARPLVRELTVRHRDGHPLATRASMSVVHGVAGALACMFLTDLSAQVAAEATAERHASFLTALLNSLSVGVMACDDTGRVIVMNPALRRIHGHPDTGPVPDDLPAAVPTFLYDARMQPLSWEQTPLMRAWRGEHLTDLDVVAKLPGRRTRVFATTAQQIQNRDGVRLGAVVVAHEVTPLRRAEHFNACRRDVERALRAATSITDAAPAVLRAVTTALGWPGAELFLIDENTDRLQAIGHHSDNGEGPEGLFGHTPVRNRGVTGRVWQSGQPLWIPDITRYADLTSENEQHRVDLCVRHGIRTVLAVPVRDGGTLLGVLTCYAGAPEVDQDLLTVLLDGVAAQIGVYVALRRAEELALQLTRSQDDFLDLVGHELRTPLTSIIANVTMLTEEATGLDEEQQQMLSTVARNTGMLQNIVDTLLDLAALESGHHRLATGPVDLVAIVADAVAALRRTTAAGVQLRTDMPHPVLVTGDAGRLRQALDDVLSNALKYSPAGADVHIRLERNGSWAELCITDTGIGTPASERDRVFDRFYRAGNVRHHGTPGSGLGLSRTRTIVQLHGGDIALRPQQPSGTSVCIRLPLDRPDPP